MAVLRRVRRGTVAGTPSGVPAGEATLDGIRRTVCQAAGALGRELAARIGPAGRRCVPARRPATCGIGSITGGAWPELADALVGAGRGDLAPLVADYVARRFLDDLCTAMTHRPPDPASAAMIVATSSALRGLLRQVPAPDRR
jgi:hypothetical protein